MISRIAKVLIGMGIAVIVVILFTFNEINAGLPLPIDEKLAYLFSKYPITPEKRGQLSNMLNIITVSNNKVLYLYRKTNLSESKKLVFNISSMLRGCYANMATLETAILIESTHENDGINKSALRLIELERIKALTFLNNLLTYLLDSKSRLNMFAKVQKENQEIIQCIDDIQPNIEKARDFITSLETAVNK